MGSDDFGFLAEQANELGDASHASYKERQRAGVMQRLKLGLEDQARTVELTPNALTESSMPPEPEE